MAAVSHPDHLLDMMVNVLPGSKEDPLTIQEDLPSASPSSPSSPSKRSPPNYLNNVVIQTHPVYQDVFESMLENSQREALTFFRRWLADLAHQHGDADLKLPKLIGKVTLSQLSKLVNAFEWLSDKKLNSVSSSLEWATAVIETVRRGYVDISKAFKNSYV